MSAFTTTGPGGLPLRRRSHVLHDHVSCAFHAAATGHQAWVKNVEDWAYAVEFRPHPDTGAVMVTHTVAGARTVQPIQPSASDAPPWMLEVHHIVQQLAANAA